MPLSASFCFFSPFSLREETFTPIFLSSFLFSLLSPSSHLGETSFGTYIRNLAHYTIKYNKKVRRLTRQIAIIHKYFIHNNIII